jgi:hypothetical protein
MSNLDKLFTEIAQKHLSIETLEIRGSDSLDFHDVSAWAVRKALAAAYDAGVCENVLKQKTVTIEVLGGVAHVKRCPHGVKVKIIDRDLARGAS